MIKFKTKLLILGLVIALFLFFKFASFIFSANKDSKKLVSTHLFLNDIDILKGKYAIIYLLKKDSVPLLIDNQNLIFANIDSVIIKKSWKSNLPNYTKPYGLFLFKDGKLIKEQIGTNFEKFQLGTLLDDSKPLQKIVIESNKEHYLTLLDSLNNKPDIFIVKNTSVMADDYDYFFSVTLPTLAFQNSDSHYNQKELIENTTKQISEDFKDYQGYKMNETTSISWKSKSNSPDNENIKAIRYFNFMLNFDCTKTFYEQIKNYDFSKYAPIKARNMALLNQSDKQEIQINEKSEISKLEERKFQLDYYELQQN